MLKTESKSKIETKTNKIIALDDNIEDDENEEENEEENETTKIKKILYTYDSSNSDDDSNYTNTVNITKINNTTKSRYYS